jgi:hypothetical protein
MKEDKLKELVSIIEDACSGNRIATQQELYSIFEEKTHSGMDFYQFKRGLSYLIKNRVIQGYRFKQGRKGGVFKTSSMDKVSITCSSGTFSGYLRVTTISRLISNLQREEKNGTDHHRPRG